MEATTQLNNLPGWVALILIIIDRAIIPLARQYFPIKSKAETARHDLELENRRFEHEMKRREVEAQENIAKLINIMDSRLGDVETEVKVIREDVGTVIRDVGSLMRRKK